jgi:Ni,Fe-hydrogenase I cytochrome b subunit
MQVERWTGRVIAAPLEDVYVYEVPVRIWHWLTVLCFIVLGVTGYLIGSPLPAIGGEAVNHFLMGWIRMIHFSTAMILIARSSCHRCGALPSGAACTATCCRTPS